LFAVDFEPILKIGEGHKVPEFQERLRARFPQFSEGQSVEVKITAPGQIETRLEKAYEFGSLANSKIVLSPRRLSREADKHQTREEVFRDIALIVEALDDIYKPITVHRVGLRYVNLFDAVQITEDLGRSVTWASLVAERYLHMPNDVLDMNSTLFSNEIHSTMERGSMVLRYGKTLRPDRGRECMHFDMDRFVMEKVSTGEIPEMVQGFSQDLFDLFSTAPGPDLVEWMHGEGLKC
jgi:uncharacterized protein (TIGR04255 family)